MSQELDELLAEIQRGVYFRAYKKRDALITKIEHHIDQLDNKTLAKYSAKYIRLFVVAVAERRMRLSTFNSLMQAFSIARNAKALRLLEKIVLSGVQKSKWKHFWLLLSVIRIKHEAKKSSIDLERNLISWYLKPNRQNKVYSTFLSNYIKHVPSFNRDLLFKHCLKHKHARDSYNKEMIDVFISICPEYEKYRIMK